ncbi:hypothetical protein [Cytobacillus purgationiresistens]|uniref:Uncharacterized protein n=1 Tax=Cytobacillus purgationiresistens TaxID=863449 RepID=A0ABU0ADN6_9BACI|nr:hypothetical protein [Cytobacillus purgationiresistens]MDQ0269349.1 hypothetical protein [Cytobacillus purgationiresistens]
MDSGQSLLKKKERKNRILDNRCPKRRKRAARLNPAAQSSY